MAICMDLCRGAHFLMSAAARTLSLVDLCDLSKTQPTRCSARCDGKTLTPLRSAPIAAAPPLYTYRCRRVFKCKACHRQFSATSGTLGSGANFRDQCNETLGNIMRLMRRDCVPDFWRGFAIDAKLAERELTFPDPMHEFNAGDGDRGAPKALQSKHWTQTKFDRSMVLLYQII